MNKIRESMPCLDRFPIRGLFLFLTLTSIGVLVSSVWKLHSVPSGSFRISELSQFKSLEAEGFGFDDYSAFKKDLREAIRSENQQLIQQLFKQINIQPVQSQNSINTPIVYTVPISNVTNTGNGTFVDIRRGIRYTRENTKASWDIDWHEVVEKDDKVRKYLDEFEDRCLTHDSLENVASRRGGNFNRSLPMCPCIPGTLKGRQKPNVEALMSLTWEQTKPIADTVSMGGYWKPLDCVARRRIAIIIPCRDREMQLRAFLVHMHPLLQRQLLEYRIFVIEQVWPSIFNKASIMNAGFLEASKVLDFDCVMFHDVDLLPEDDRSIIYCGAMAQHYGAHLDKWGYNIGYSRIFGGAVTLTREQFVKTNGYSNTYFGWGGEDDEFDKRVRAAGFEINRPPPEVSKHSVLMHSRDKANPVNPGSAISWIYQPEMYPKEGLNTVAYTASDLTIEPLYTFSRVRLKVPSNKAFLAQRPYDYLHIRGTCRDSPQPVDVIERLPLSLTSCRYQCDFQPACRGITYAERQDLHCTLLKNLCEMNMDAPDFNTYVKIFNETATQYSMQVGDCNGNDIEGLSLTLTDCMRECNLRTRCAGFVYGEQLTLSCWLKNGTCVQAKPNLLGVRSFTKLTT